jgi:hypothetical protein
MLLLAVFGMALLLLALAAIPLHALAGISDELVARRSQLDTRRLRAKTTASSWTDGRVQNGVTYQYDLVPVDAAGNPGTEASRKARPTGFRTPKNGTTLSTPIAISWVDVPKSDYSNIQVWRVRNSQLTRKILSVWPKETDFTLLSHWRYQGQEHRHRHGRTYRIYGWPGFGSVSGANYGKSYGWVSSRFAEMTRSVRPDSSDDIAARRGSTAP